MCEKRNLLLETNGTNQRSNNRRFLVAAVHGMLKWLPVIAHRLPSNRYPVDYESIARETMNARPIITKIEVCEYEWELKDVGLDATGAIPTYRPGDAFKRRG